MNDDTYAAEFVAGFLIGALVGAAVALLFAPQPGEETRSLIRERGIELGQKAEDLQSQAKDKASELQSQAKDRASELQSQAKDKASELQSQAKERASGLQSKVKEAVEEGKAAAADKRQQLLSQLDEAQADLEI